MDSVKVLHVWESGEVLQARGSELGDRIASLVLQQFSQWQKKVKSGVPIVRSNKTKEWTVLASIVILKGEDVEVLTLTTGMKTIPYEKLQDSKGLILHDLHAEILSLRGFNYILMEEIEKVRQGSESELITKDLHFNPDLKLLLYISEPPCGDLSMDLLNGGESWKRDFQGDVIRGRAHYNKVGIIRTKPGRMDSLVSLSKSCSDKICSRQYYGLGNSTTLKMVKDKIKLDYLVIPEEKIIRDLVQRCFKDRVGEKLIEVLPTTKRFEFEKQDKTGKACDLSLVVVRNWKEVVGNKGLLNGRSKLQLASASRLSNASMVNRFHGLISAHQSSNDLISSIKYSDLKKSDPRNKDKTYIRDEVLKDKWVANYRDDFDLQLYK